MMSKDVTDLVAEIGVGADGVAGIAGEASVAIEINLSTVGS